MMTEPPTPLIEQEQTITHAFIFKLRYSIIVILAAFILGLIIGTLIPSSLVEQMMGVIVGDIDPEQYSSLTIFWLLLTNNLRVCLISLVLAPILIFEPLITFTNGALITAVGVLTIAKTGSIGLFLAGILPHGILEMAAIITCSAAALSLGITFDVAIFTKGLKAAWPEMIFQLKVFLAGVLAIPLAALIETYITPWVMEMI